MKGLRFYCRCRSGQLGSAAFALGCCLAAGIASANDVSDAIAAKKLLDEARQSEMQGDTARQFSLLREAIRVAPNFDLARWQMGQIRDGDRWIAVEDAQRAAAANPKQAEYRQLRANAGDSLEGQVKLARWCRKNGLNQEAQFHWASVLSVQPNNEEALGALDLRLFGGRPMSQSQIDALKEYGREWKKAAKLWAPKIAKWRRAISDGDATDRNAALAEIEGLREVEGIAALEAVTLGRDSVDKHQSDDCYKISMAFMRALEKMSESAATVSLVRHAVLAPSPDVRTMATNTLKPRPQQEFVPLLLSGLAMPVESSFSVTTSDDGSVHYRHSLYREGQDTDWSVESRQSAMQHDMQARRYIWDVKTETMTDLPTESSVVVAMRKANVAARRQKGYASAAAAVESQVQQANEFTEALNSRVVPVLAATTGQNFETPKAWWDWWQENNEYYASGDHPVDHRYYSGVDSYYYRDRPIYEVNYPPPPPPPPGLRMSCFAKGTLVWTKTGQQPIETIELGDLVLAQDVDTGELAYKPVIGRTVRPPSPLMRLSLGSQEILTTRGHPFWVAGVGWKMAKELGDGAVLHGVTGSARLATVKDVDEAEAYNLVIADFNTYFVSESGLLVHDNTPRLPTRATVPGLAASK